MVPWGVAGGSWCRDQPVGAEELSVVGDRPLMLLRPLHLPMRMFHRPVRRTVAGRLPTDRSGQVDGIAALYARAMSSGFATKENRSRCFGHIRKPDFSGDWHPAGREIKQDRRST